LRVEGGILATSSITAQAFYGDGTTLTGIVINPMTSKLNINATPSIGTQNQAGISIDTHVFVTAGNVGIGTTGPGTPLHIRYNTGVGLTIQSTGVDSYSELDLTNDARTWRISTTGAEGDGLRIYDITAGAARMFINTAGNVGIGTTNPAEKLDVNGISRFLGNAKFSSFIVGDNGANFDLRMKSGGASGAIQFYESTGVTERVRITDAGNVGIGTTSPTEKLEVGDSGKKSFEVRPDTNYVSLLIDGIEVARMRP
jgi:hypothetical protein